MKIALLTNVLSPHQMPLAKALVERVGAEAYRYIFTDAKSFTQARKIFRYERKSFTFGSQAKAWLNPARTRGRAWNGKGVYLCR